MKLRLCSGTISLREGTPSAKRQEFENSCDLEIIVRNISEDIFVCAEGCAGLYDKACYKMH